MYSETGLSQADVMGMTWEALGTTLPPSMIKEEDEDEIKFIEKDEEGTEYVDKHPGFDKQWHKKHDRNLVQHGRSTSTLRRPKIRPPPASHNFNLASTRKKRRTRRAGSKKAALVGAQRTGARSSRTSEPEAEGAGGEEEEPPEEVEVYTPPNEGDPDFSPVFQHLVMAAVPLFEESVQVNNTADKPMYLNDFFEGATWFEYAGTQTLPPCQKATFLVRREAFHTSTAQVEGFFTSLHAMSEQAGNYRTLMPMNGRVIQTRQSVRLTNIPPRIQAAAAHDDTERKFRARRTGEDAIKIAETAQNYARDIDQRLKRAAVAHVMALWKTTPPPPPVPPPPPGLPYSKMWMDPEMINRALGSSAANHAKAVAEALREHGTAAAIAASADAANRTGEAYLTAHAAASTAALGSASPSPAVAGDVDGDLGDQL